MLIFFRELSTERKFRPFFFFFISTHKVPNLINFYLFSFFLLALILIMRSLRVMAVEGGGNPEDGKIEGKIVWATKFPRVLNCQNICNIFDDLIFRRSFFLFRKGLFCFFRNFFSGLGSFVWNKFCFSRVPHFFAVAIKLALSTFFVFFTGTKFLTCEF